MHQKLYFLVTINISDYLPVSYAEKACEILHILAHGTSHHTATH